MGRKRKSDHAPLTADQQRLVETYLKKWKPFGFLRRHWPGVVRHALANGMTEDDVVQIALTGVMRAATTWDGEKSAFSTYANWWAMQHVSRAAKRLDKRQFGKEISGELRQDEDGGKLWDTISDPNSPEGLPEEFDRLDTIRARVHDAIRFLPEPMRGVVELRFGLTDGRARMLDEIAAEMSITCERVRQLEAKAIQRISIPLLLSCRELVNLGTREFWMASIHRGREVLRVEQKSESPPSTTD